MILGSLVCIFAAGFVIQRLQREGRIQSAERAVPTH